METVNLPISELTANPKNYRAHPSAQVDALRASLRANGVYRNVVASSDKVLLAGHGVVEAAKAEGLTELPVVILPFAHTDPRAERVLVADNELQRGAEDDETALAALLADLQRTTGLEGTGWDDGALDTLIAGLQAEEFGKTPLDYTPQNSDDQSGAGSAWGAMQSSDRVRFVWGDIEAALEYDLYERVKAVLDAAFNSGGSYHGELERILMAGCDECA